MGDTDHKWLTQRLKSSSLPHQSMKRAVVRWSRNRAIGTWRILPLVQRTHAHNSLAAFLLCVHLSIYTNNSADNIDITIVRSQHVLIYLPTHIIDKR